MKIGQIDISLWGDNGFHYLITKQPLQDFFDLQRSKEDVVQMLNVKL